MFVSVLLIDTCGVAGSLALVDGETVVAPEMLPEREASAALLPALQRLMQGHALEELEAVGVVSGPGSFTGVRVGVAAAKGLCEGTGARLIAVSRLAVLADAAGLERGYAVLDAGRGQIYVRDAEGRERLMQRDALVVDEGMRVAVTEPAMLEALAELGAEWVPLDAAHALRCVLRAMDGPVVDAGLIDANYVRSESDIYAKPARGPEA